MLLERVAGAVPVSILFTRVSNTLEADSQGASLLTQTLTRRKQRNWVTSNAVAIQKRPSTLLTFVQEPDYPTTYTI